ncbi:TerD family protein [Streptomyces sp. NPDC049954]|uniref:TerD family protein n=1 Tax=Streptomyces sp. NPDC049954 TaxID=3155779 RepID=UPI00341DA287
MHEMAKGSNVDLSALSEDADSVLVGLNWSSADGEGDADVSVLLLGDDGRVRSDADFFFYNNPSAADGSVQLLGKVPTGTGSEDRVSVDLSAVPAAVERVVVAASRDRGSRFGDLDGLRVTLGDRHGEPLLSYPIDDATVESAFLFGELYRRNGHWKFRAIGQGYESGLAGLATDFGIDVDEEAEEATEAAAGTEARTGAGDSGAGPQAVAASGGSSGEGSPGEGTVVLPAPRVHTEGAAAAVLATATATGVAAPPVPDGTAVPAPTGTGVTGSPTAPRPRRPRTAKKKVTLPKVVGKSLAENEAWRPARLFPVPSLKSDREREVRATSVLLAVLAEVPEFARRLLAGFGAPAGRTQTFTEVVLPHGDSPRRPDGVIRVERAGKLWTALVETKTNGNPLKSEQVQAYMDIATRRGYEAVITLSNDVALEGTPLVEVRTDGRRKNRAALRHLSWAEVTQQAQLLIRHEGVGNAAHAWLLQELLHYLQHDNSGCHGFQNMGPAWVPVRNGIDAETLCLGDPQAVAVVESWERLIRQVCLRLGGELGRRTLPVQRARRGSGPTDRRLAQADRLCGAGLLEAEIRTEGAVSPVGIAADLRTGKIRVSMEVPPPEAAYPLTVVKRLLRLLEQAPADLHVETLVSGGSGKGPRGTLERLRPEPGDLLPKDGSAVTGFRLSLFKGMGLTRGSAETGFIRSVDDAVDRFHGQVVARFAAGGGATTSTTSTTADARTRATAAST